MLLSYFAPCYPEGRQICSQWLDRAFQHAKNAGLDQATSEVMTDRSRLIWCCCIVRDRIISFSSRRLLNPMNTIENWIRVNRQDFGLEICLPRYSDPTSRTELVDSFLMLCRLSESLADIIDLGQHHRRQLSYKEPTITRQDMLHISQLDIRLREWKRIYQTWKTVPHIAPMSDSKGSWYLRTIVAE
jgi:hypothetical protein